MNNRTDQSGPGLTLQVSFDIDQDGSLLMLTPLVNNGGTDPVDEGEQYAGDFYFPKGEVIGLTVTGWGKATIPFSFEIQDCHFITRPKIIAMSAGAPTQYAPPSPFYETNTQNPRPYPWYSLALNFAQADTVHQGAENYIVQTWNDTLQVSKLAGRWEISFLLTVAITRGDTTSPEVRVFWFDPEGEVGTGAVIREDDMVSTRTQSSAQQPARA